jgi:hypothetical protein
MDVMDTDREEEREGERRREREGERRREREGEKRREEKEGRINYITFIVIGYLD